MSTNQLIDDPNIVNYLVDIDRATLNKEEASKHIEADNSFRDQHVYRSLDDEDNLVGLNEASYVEWHQKLVVKFCQELFSPHTSNLVRAQHYFWVMDDEKPDGEIIPFSFQACCLYHDAYDMEQVKQSIEYRLKKLGLYDELMEYIDSPQFRQELTAQERKFREQEELSKQGNLFGSESDKQFRRKSSQRKKAESAESCGDQPDMFTCYQQGIVSLQHSNES